MSKSRTAKRILARGTLFLLGMLLGLVVVTLIDGWTAFGVAPSGARLARIHASPEWQAGAFENTQPMWTSASVMLGQIFDKQPLGSPDSPLPIHELDRSRFLAPPEDGLRVTWLGHSTLLVELDGFTLLTDPVWGARCSPVRFAGPERWYAPPLPLAELPELDAILISHDHYDHLDYPTIAALASREVPFIVPLGVGAHLESWGVPPTRITELDWWQETKVEGHSAVPLRVVMTPARHASGRHVFDQMRTLWASYAILGPTHRAYFSGDTGLFPALRDIGARYGPFDVTMIEVGAYGQGWPDWHLGPEQALEAHAWVRGKVLLPVHWGLFDLAYHGWTEPIERVMAARKDATVVTPRPGEPVSPLSPRPPERWWPEAPWRTAAEYPIVATDVDSRR